MPGMSRRSFTGPIGSITGRPMRVMGEQPASPTAEMNGEGFQTAHPYDQDALFHVRQADGRLDLTSLETTTVYSVQVRPVFVAGDESVTEQITDATIVKVGGRPLPPLSVRRVWLENRGGRIYVNTVR